MYEKPDNDIDEKLLDEYRLKSGIELIDLIIDDIKKDGGGYSPRLQALREKIVLLESNAMDFIINENQLPRETVELFKNSLLIAFVKRVCRLSNRKTVFIPVKEIDDVGGYIMNAVPDMDRKRFEIVLTKKN